MWIPLKYNLRNLVVRRVSTGMTILGIALVVTVFLLVMSLAEGVRKTLATTVSPQNIVVLRVGAQVDVMSFVNRDQYEAIRTLDGLARGDDGRALVRELMRTSADLRPDLEAKTLTVRLHPLPSRLQDEAVRHLAEELSATETVFPGTDLRLVFALPGPS